MEQVKKSSLWYKIGWLLQLPGPVVALANIPVTANKQPLAEVVINLVAPGKQNHETAKNIQTILEHIRAWDYQALNGGCLFDPQMAAGLCVFVVMVFGVLWLSRWYDVKDGPRTVERFMNAMVPPSLVILTLISPSAAVMLAITHVIFEFNYPLPRDVYLVAVNSDGIQGIRKV